MFKTTQFWHQREDFEKSKDLIGWAWFWEMGTGKAKQIIDTAAHLYRESKIHALLVIAPNGVHVNLHGQELPAHMPEDVPMHSVVYYTGRAGTKKHRERIDKLMDPAPKHLRILSMSYDALCTVGGRKVAENFLKDFDAMMVLDESSMIKTPRSQRTKACMALGKLAKYRRIADGTPVAEGPFDVYAQLMFLYQDYWKRHGLSSYMVFKTMFGQFQQRVARQGHQYMHHLGYQNLDYLQKLISDTSTRYLKEDCLDLPPKLYKKLTFSLTTHQQEIYDQLKDELHAELNADVAMDAPSAIVRLMRLQQVASGYAVGEEKPKLSTDLPPMSPTEAMARAVAMLTEDNKRVVIDLMPPEENPRLQLLLGYLETVHHKAIIWCRFTRDVDLVCAALGERVLRYDGSTSDRDRETALTAFRNPKGPQFFCANLATLSRGVTLVIAKTVIYYTNSFHLILRLQSEDRAHRIGQDQKVQYVDIVAEGTVDEHIVKTLRNKFDLAAMVTGDRLREWIQ